MNEAGSGPSNTGGYDPYGEAEGRSLLEPPNPYLPAEGDPYGAQQARPGANPTQPGPGHAPSQAPFGQGYPQPGSAPAGYQQPGSPQQPGYQQPGYQGQGVPQPNYQPNYPPGYSSAKGWPPGSAGPGQRPPQRGRGLVIGAVSLVLAIAVGLGIYASTSGGQNPTAAPTRTSSSSTPSSNPSLPATANPPGAASGAIPVVWSYEIANTYAGLGSMAGGDRESNQVYVTPDVVIGRFVEDSSREGGRVQLVGLNAVTGDLVWDHELYEARCAPPITGFGGNAGLSLVCSGMVGDETTVQVLDANSGDITQEWTVPMDQIGIIHATSAGVVLLSEPDLSTGAAQVAWYSADGDQEWLIDMTSLLEADDYVLGMPEGYEWYDTNAFTLGEDNVVVHLNAGPNALLLTADSQELFSDCRDLLADEDRFFCGQRSTIVARDAAGETLWTTQDASFLMDYTRNGSVLMVSDDPYADSINVRGMNPDTGELVGESTTLTDASYGIMTGSAELGLVHGGSTLAAFSPQGPELLWTIELPGDYQREAYPVGDVVVVDGGSNGMYVIDAATGEIRETWDSSDWIVGPWEDQVVTVGYYDGIAMRTLE